MRCPKMTPKHISRRRERQKSRGRKEEMRKRAAASSGRQDAESGGGGMERRGKDGFFGRWGEVWVEEEEWRRRREKGRKEGRRTVARSLLLLLRPSAPPQKNDCCRLQCRPTVKTPKRAYIPEMGLAPESGFTLYPSFLSSLFSAPRGGECPACTPATNGYVGRCNAFLLGEKWGYERASLMCSPLPFPPPVQLPLPLPPSSHVNGGREIAG